MHMVDDWVMIPVHLSMLCHIVCTPPAEKTKSYGRDRWTTNNNHLPKWWIWCIYIVFFVSGSSGQLKAEDVEDPCCFSSKAFIKSVMFYQLLSTESHVNFRLKNLDSLVSFMQFFAQFQAVTDQFSGNMFNIAGILFIIHNYSIIQLLNKNLGLIHFSL